MSSFTGTIRFTQELVTEVPRPIYQITKYEWEGEPTCIFDYRLAEQLFQQNNLYFPPYPDYPRIIPVGPYRLRVIEFNGVVSQHFKCVREDYWAAPLVYFYYRWLNPTLNKTFQRMIITLAVWRLAKYSEQTYPSIQDVYLVRWARKLVKQLLDRLKMLYTKT